MGKGQKTNRRIKRAVGRQVGKHLPTRKKLLGILGAVAAAAAQWGITTMPLLLRAVVLFVLCASLIWLIVLWSQNWGGWLRWTARIVIGLSIVVFSSYQLHTEDLKQKALETERMLDNLRRTKEAPWIAPRGPGVKVESAIPIPSSQMCVGLSELAELQCLCPRPIDYTLAAMPQPKDNNYATEVTIRRVREPLYRIRLFSRAMISEANLIHVWPNASAAVTGLQTMDVDRYSIIIHSTAPQNGFRVVLQTTEGLRIKCINQEN